MPNFKNISNKNNIVNSKKKAVNNNKNNNNNKKIVKNKANGYYGGRNIKLMFDTLLRSKITNFAASNCDTSNIKHYRCKGSELNGRNVNINGSVNQTCFNNSVYYDVYEVPTKTNAKNSAYGMFLTAYRNNSTDKWMIGTMHIDLIRKKTQGSQIATVYRKVRIKIFEINTVVTFFDNGDVYLCYDLNGTLNNTVNKFRYELYKYSNNVNNSFDSNNSRLRQYDNKFEHSIARTMMKNKKSTIIESKNNTVIKNSRNKRYR